MPTAYTVDRASGLSQGMVLDRYDRRVNPPVLQSHVDALFPNGLTRHGDTYFLDTKSVGTVANSSIELIFEYIRRARFPGCPSRFESVFGFETFAEADTFRSHPDWGQAGAPVWEVSTAEAPFRADMTCLTIGGAVLVISYFAEQYWSGQPNPDAQSTPIWELLLRPPVTVVQQVG